jgi:alkaline phosphatase D
MTKKYIFNAALTCFLFIVAPVEALEKTPLTRMAFGSCSSQKVKEQPLWGVIAKAQPQAFLWTGDVIYIDASSEDSMRGSYQKQLTNELYKKFLSIPGLKVFGVWDDNDYGLNNGGKEFKLKKLSQQLFLDFLNEPKDSPRRKQEGIYASHVWGPVGTQVKIYLLDVRYHKTAVGDTDEHDILGAAQWAWLENEMKSSQAQLNIFVSGIQILPSEHIYEKWAQYPKAKEKLLNLIKKHPLQRPVFISGDRHIAEISRLPKKHYQGSQDLIEVTSSGMTHSWKDNPGEPNQLRDGELFKDLNFGWLEIEWKNPPQIKFQIKDKVGGVVREVRL